jgi:hypothetical protein
MTDGQLIASALAGLSLAVTFVFVARQAFRDGRRAERLARAVPVPREDPEGDAIRGLDRSYRALKELGWRDAMYAPRDGTPIDLIEVGCTAVLTNCYRDEVGFWQHAANETWPTRPILFRFTQAAK